MNATARAPKGAGKVVHNSHGTRISKPKKKVFDLYTFVASEALKADEPFRIECNCGGVVVVSPPFQDDFVICPSCEKSIKMFVIEGDPGYIIGADPTGKPMLILVQGSKAKHPDELSQAERDEILEKAKAHFPEETNSG